MRKALWIGLSAPTLIGVAVVVLATVGAEHYIAGALPSLGDRYGVQIEVAAISASPGEIRLERVEVTPDGQSQPVVRASRIVAHYSLGGLLSGRRIDSVVIRGARFAVRRTDAGSLEPLSELLRRVRGQPEGSAPIASEKAPSAEIRVEDASIIVDDSRGLHARAVVNARLSRGVARIVVADLQVSGRHSKVLSVRSTMAELELRHPMTVHAARLVEPVLAVRERNGGVELTSVAAVARDLGSELLGRTRPQQNGDDSPRRPIRIAIERGRVESQFEGHRVSANEIYGWLAPDMDRRRLGMSVRGRLAEAPWEVEADVDLTAERVLGHLEVSELPLASFREVLPQLPIDLSEPTILGAAFDFKYEHVPGRLGVDGRMRADRLSIVSPLIASEPLRDIDVEVSGKGALWLRSGELALTDARVSVNSIPFLVHGDVARAEGMPRVLVDVALPPMPCGALLRSMPAALVANLGGMTLEGVFGADLHVSYDMARPRDTDVRFDIGNRCRLISDGAVASIERLRGPFIQHASSAGEPVEFVTGPGSPSWTPYEEISPHLIDAVLTTEDGGFFSHHGFSAESIRQAIVRNLREGRFAVGGSTISMQLVKNVFLTRDKTIARKLQEGVLTWMLEQSMAKEEILELYLNVIEYGPSLYGIRNASEHFFGVSPGELTPIQAVYVATLLPNPVARYSTFLRGSASPQLMGRLHRILRLMASRGRLEVPLEEALAQPLAFRGAGPVASGAIGNDSAVQ